MKEIGENDWQHLSQRKEEWLNRACGRINAEAAEILQSLDFQTDYERYLALYRHFKNRDQILEECFDDWRRSAAISRILALRRHELLTDEELREFSPEIQQLAGRKV